MFPRNKTHKHKEWRVTKPDTDNLQKMLKDCMTLTGFWNDDAQVVVDYLIDLALPNNKIPRVFINTGIEYSHIVKFVKQLAEKDERIVILNSGVNIKEMLETYGYPFKSKEHSKLLSLYQHGSVKSNWLNNYLSDNVNATRFRCPKILKYQFTPNFNLKVSSNCCDKLKKQPIKKWEKENNKNIALTGMRKSEGGQRASINCIITDKENKLTKFHPLLVINDDFENWFIINQNIKLCDLYYPPFNFERTGCKGCPFNLNLQKQLDVMKNLLPNEYNQCELIWKPVYEEYRRLGYRLKKIINEEKWEQMNIFDFIEK